MSSKAWRRRVALVVLCGMAAGLITLRLLAGPQEGPHQPAPAGNTVAISISSEPPKGAILLFTGKPEQMRDNWYQRYTDKPAGWSVGEDGVATPNKTDISSKLEFGDCYVHAEFRASVDANGKTIGHGNSGVAPHGRYEIQILDSYGAKPESHGCGALYSQKPPIVNASRKPGEWQTYDILFRAPRFDANGQVIEKPRATVIQNGIIVQNNEEFLGMTGIQYSQYKEMARTGPLVLQGDHDPVQFRNVWIVPL